MALATRSMWGIPFVYDDAWWLSQPWAMTTAPFRLGLWLSDGLPWGPRAVLLALHVLNGALLWVVARRWMSQVGALLMLTLFWLHPLALQPVLYVTWGREIWVATWALLSVIGLLHGSMTGAVIGVCALIGAAAMKTSAVPLMAAIPMLWAVRAGYGRLMAVVIALSALATWPTHLSVGVVDWAVSLVGTLRLALWPDGLSILHDWRAASPAVGMAALIVVLSAGVVAWRSSAWAIGIWAWMVALTLPRAFLRDAPLFTEAHTYVPFLALWMGSGAALDGLSAKALTHG